MVFDTRPVSKTQEREERGRETDRERKRERERERERGRAAGPLGRRAGVRCRLLQLHDLSPTTRVSTELQESLGSTLYTSPNKNTH